MILADFLNTAALVTLFLLAVRMLQTHLAKDTTLGSALGFVFH